MDLKDGSLLRRTLRFDERGENPAAANEGQYHIPDRNTYWGSDSTGRVSDTSGSVGSVGNTGSFLSVGNVGTPSIDGVPNSPQDPSILTILAMHAQGAPAPGTLEIKIRVYAKQSNSVLTSLSFHHSRSSFESERE